MRYPETPWGERAYLAMVRQKLKPDDIATGIGKSGQYVRSLIYGGTNNQKGRKMISDFLGISDSNEPD